MIVDQIEIMTRQDIDHEAVCELIADSFRGKFQSLVRLDDSQITQL